MALILNGMEDTPLWRFVKFFEQWRRPGPVWTESLLKNGDLLYLHFELLDRDNAPRKGEHESVIRF
jgi:hypothetical protein